MITPTLLNNLQWQAYLIFMCTNLAFIPLVYFWYVVLLLSLLDYKLIIAQLSRNLKLDPGRSGFPIHQGWKQRNSQVHWTQPTRQNQSEWRCRAGRKENDARREGREERQ